MVSVVVINYNNKEILKTCLNSILKQSIVCEDILVVDNASTDGVQEVLADIFPSVRLIQNSTNEFFAKAANKGILHAKHEYILLLNNDIVLDEKFIENALKAFEKDSSVGMVAGKLISSNGTTIDSAGQVLRKDRRVKEYGHGKRQKVFTKEEGYVFGVCGACVLYSRQMLEEVRGNGTIFNEEYLMYYEDIDLNWRANKKGYKGYYVPNAIAYHIRGATTKQYAGKSCVSSLRGSSDTSLRGDNADEAISIKKKHKSFLSKRFMFPNLSLGLRVLLVRNRYLLIKNNDSLVLFLIHLPFIFLWEVQLWTYLCIFDRQVIKQLLNLRTKKVTLGILLNESEE